MSTKEEPVYNVAAKHEAWGNFGWSNYVGIQVLVAGVKLTTVEESKIGDFVQDIQNFIFKSKEESDPAKIQERNETRTKLIGCFEGKVGPIWVKDIPNGYCQNHYYAFTSPWLEVYTIKGPIKIGWRNRVIHLSWEESDIEQSAEELFPDENVTKEDWMIHAWGYDKAREYISNLLASP